MRMVVEKSLIRYELSGTAIREKNPVIVFLHGWGRGMEDFDEQRKLLAARFPDAAFLQMDLPGFGGSPMNKDEGYSLNDYCAALSAILHKIHAGPAILIGHSLGGRIAIKFARLYPDRVKKLILISAAGIPSQSHRIKLLAVGRTLFGTIFFAFRDFTYILRLQNLLGAVFGSRDYQVAHGAMRETLKKVLAEDLRPDAAAVRVPTLLIWGDHDQIVPPEDGKTYHALIKKSRLLILPGGHFIFLEQPVACAREIASFLKHG